MNKFFCFLSIKYRLCQLIFSCDMIAQKYNKSNFL
jgi:hypothetical protein